MFKKILVPTDFSSSAQHAFEYAVELNKLYGARLYLVHVLQDFTDFSEFNLSPTILPQLYAEFEENATKRLDDMIVNLVPEPMCCDMYILHGVAYYEVTEFAKAEGIDLIVIGSRGRTGLSHLIFGSTAEKIIKRATCPVLTIKHPDVKAQIA
ncbi:MAG: hypothetical protein BWY87_00553 [Deltaproteobacteria bacterium ADurb.Bin510]|nr:MAG: hypothetical protein BWY87_00553 [Deltaproteobacteria bacterium ADurb.Bin510]